MYISNAFPYHMAIITLRWQCVNRFILQKFSEQFCYCVCETSKNTLMTFWLRCLCWKCKHGRPSFQFTVFFESKKMLSFAALGLSLDPVNNIWKSGKSGQKIKMYFFIFLMFWKLYLCHACFVFAACLVPTNLNWQVGETFWPKMQKISPGLSNCVSLGAFPSEP